MRRLTTQSGQTYLIHDDGAIERTDGQWAPDASRWQMIGVQSSRGGWIIPLAEVDAVVREWRYKNGKPMFRLVDRDHGTMRVWGDGIMNLVPL